MLVEGVPDAVVIAAVTGGVSAAGTVAALSVKVNNLRERLDRLQEWIAKIEERLEQTRERMYER